MTKQLIALVVCMCIYECNNNDLTSKNIGGYSPPAQEITERYRKVKVVKTPPTPKVVESVPEPTPKPLYVAPPSPVKQVKPKPKVAVKTVTRAQSQPIRSLPNKPPSHKGLSVLAKIN